jgi:hypothetical protein
MPSCARCVRFGRSRDFQIKSLTPAGPIFGLQDIAWFEGPDQGAGALTAGALESSFIDPYLTQA